MRGHSRAQIFVHAPFWDIFFAYQSTYFALRRGQNGEAAFIEYRNFPLRFSRRSGVLPAAGAFDVVGRHPRRRAARRRGGRDFSF